MLRIAPAIVTSDGSSAGSSSRSTGRRFVRSDRGQPNHSIVPLKSTIRVLDGFGKSLEVILPKLRDGYIVPDPGFARELALSNPDAFFLSQSGECFHNVTVTGGKQRAEGPLSMKRELRDVLRLMADLEGALRHEEQPLCP